MGDNEVSDYIRKELKKGYSKANIKKAMTKAGYDESVINKAFGEVGEHHHASLKMLKISVITSAIIIMILVIAFLIPWGNMSNIFDKTIDFCKDDFERHDGYIEMMEGSLVDVDYEIHTIDYERYFEELQNRNCDILMDVSPSVEREAILVFSEDLGEDYYLAFRKNDTKLRDKINGLIFS